MMEKGNWKEIFKEQIICMFVEFKILLYNIKKYYI